MITLTHYNIILIKTLYSADTNTLKYIIICVIVRFFINNFNPL